MEKGKKNEELFCSMPVPQAILTLAVPTVGSQIITIIYNMADTFFIGQLGDPKQVAAATLAMPLFMFMTALVNLFGVGGASLISRFLGGGERKKASRCGASDPGGRIFQAGKFRCGIWRYFEYGVGSAFYLRAASADYRSGGCNTDFQYNGNVLLPGLYPKNKVCQCTDTFSRNVYTWGTYSGRSNQCRDAKLSDFHDGNGFQYGAQSYHCWVF